MTIEKTPRVIIPKDDAFHGNLRHIAAEWWYFDALFTNGYSVHVGIKTFTRKHLGLVSPIIEIYKDNELLKICSKRLRLKRCNLSKELAEVSVDNIMILWFDDIQYDKDGSWNYHVEFNIDDCAVNLDFHGLTQGWKIETDRESWTVALPKAKVSGQMTVCGERMAVEGIGYHDHNWNYTMQTARDYGRAWYWGKIHSTSINLVWANIVKSRTENEYHAIINVGKDLFYDVHAENMEFSSEGTKLIGKKSTPLRFHIVIDDVVDGVCIKADIVAEIVGIHLDTVLRSPYWRYHVKTHGSFSVGNIQESIDGLEIMEYMQFRRIQK